MSSFGESTDSSPWRGNVGAGLLVGVGQRAMISNNRRVSGTAVCGWARCAVTRQLRNLRLLTRSCQLRYRLPHNSEIDRIRSVMRNPAVLARRALQHPRRAVAYATPFLVAPFARSETLHRLRLGLTSRSDMFARAYQDATWGSQESGSGTGSELRATEVVRANLASLLARHDIGALLDAPCGDWNWMQHVDLSGIEYFGADIVPDVVAKNREKYQDSNISFLVADLTRDELPRVNAILCRDCLIHASYSDISAILANFRKTGATWLLVNTFPEIGKNLNQFTGTSWRRLNFQLPPFNFPPPIEALSDGGNVLPSQLALWQLQELPEFVAG
jgi:SAM-dependent methyltransferase